MRVNMMMLAAVCGLALLATGAHAGAVELDGKTFDKEVTESGKTFAFVKFFAPWCGHCKNMAPAWNKLGDDYADSATVIIADVDCTKDDSKDLCTKYGARGYPTVKFFNAASDKLGDAYKGGRDYEALSTFVKENLGTAVDAVDAVEEKKAGAVELFGETFDKEVTESGKSAFVKFFAPWCGHCKSMAPAWNKLGEEYADSATVIIADVDCTKDDNKELCKKYGANGYPTIKYFTGATAALGDAYKGGRDYDALSAWAKENLGPVCGAENVELCNDEQKATIAAHQKKTAADLTKEVEANEAKLKKADKDLEELLESLQAQYEAGKEKKDAVIAEVSPKMTLLRSVQRFKAATDADVNVKEL